MEENAEPVRNYTKAYGTYKKSVRQTEQYNPYEIRPLSDFRELIEAMKTHKYYGKNTDKFYEYGYDRLNGKRLCKNPYGKTEKYVILYINFFSDDDEPMTIVYVVNKEIKRVEYKFGETRYDSTKKKDDPEYFLLYNNFIPISYSKNAVDEDGKPYTIDDLIKYAGIKQFKKNTTKLGDNVTENYQNLYMKSYQKTFKPEKIRGFDSRAEIFEIAGECLKSMFKKPNIAPLINDYKKTVEEMKWDPDPSMISFTGEHVREEAKKWDKNVGRSEALNETSNKRPADELEQNEDFKRTKTSGGKNKKTTKRRKNKRRQTRKRN